MPVIFPESGVPSGIMMNVVAHWISETVMDHL